MDLLAERFATRVLNFVLVCTRIGVLDQWRLPDCWCLTAWHRFGSSGRSSPHGFDHLHPHQVPHFKILFADGFEPETLRLSVLSSNQWAKWTAHNHADAYFGFKVLPRYCSVCVTSSLAAARNLLLNLNLVLQAGYRFMLNLVPGYPDIVTQIRIQQNSPPYSLSILVCSACSMHSAR